MNAEDLRKFTPFSTYDFLGYLIPGSTFIATGYFFDRWLSSVAEAPLTLLFKNFAQIVQEVNTGGEANAFNSIVAILLIFIVCYTVGHIIATLSSFFIDRYLIKSGFRYPLINFLNQDKSNEVVSPSRIFKTRARCALVLIYLTLITTVQLILINSNQSLINFIWWILGGSVAFFLIFTFYFPKRLIKFLSYIPSKLGAMIEQHLDMSGKMDENFASLVINQIKKDFKIDLKVANNSKGYSNAYWLMFLKVSEKSPVSQGMLVNWLHLYSYARNTSTAFFLTSVYLTTVLIINGGQLFDHSLIARVSYFYGAFFILSLLISLILLIRYYYLFSSYYTKFLLRSYYYISTRVEAERLTI